MTRIPILTGTSTDTSTSTQPTAATIQTQPEQYNAIDIGGGHIATLTESPQYGRQVQVTGFQVGTAGYTGLPIYQSRAIPISWSEQNIAKEVGEWGLSAEQINQITQLTKSGMTPIDVSASLVPNIVSPAFSTEATPIGQPRYNKPPAPSVPIGTQQLITITPLVETGRGTTYAERYTEQPSGARVFVGTTSGQYVPINPAVEQAIIKTQADIPQGATDIQFQLKPSEKPSEMILTGSYLAPSYPLQAPTSGIDISKTNQLQSQQTLQSPYVGYVQQGYKPLVDLTTELSKKTKEIQTLGGILEYKSEDIGKPVSFTSISDFVKSSSEAEAFSSVGNFARSFGIVRGAKVAGQAVLTIPAVVFQAGGTIGQSILYPESAKANVQPFLGEIKQMITYPKLGNLPEALGTWWKQTATPEGLVTFGTQVLIGLGLYQLLKPVQVQGQESISPNAKSIILPSGEGLSTEISVAESTVGKAKITSIVLTDSLSIPGATEKQIGFSTTLTDVSTPRLWGILPPSVKQTVDTSQIFFASPEEGMGAGEITIITSKGIKTYHPTALSIESGPKYQMGVATSDDNLIKFQRWVMESTNDVPQSIAKGSVTEGMVAQGEGGVGYSYADISTKAKLAEAPSLVPVKTPETIDLRSIVFGKSQETWQDLNQGLTKSTINIKGATEFSDVFGFGQSDQARIVGTAEEISKQVQLGGEQPLTLTTGKGSFEVVTSKGTSSFAEQGYEALSKLEEGNMRVLGASISKGNIVETGVEYGKFKVVSTEDFLKELQSKFFKAEVAPIKLPTKPFENIPTQTPPTGGTVVAEAPSQVVQPGPARLLKAADISVDKLLSGKLGGISSLGAPIIAGLSNIEASISATRPPITISPTIAALVGMETMEVSVTRRIEIGELRPRVTTPVEISQRTETKPTTIFIGEQQIIVPKTTSIFEAPPTTTQFTSLRVQPTKEIYAGLPNPYFPTPATQPKANIVVSPELTHAHFSEVGTIAAQEGGVIQNIKKRMDTQVQTINVLKSMQGTLSIQDLKKMQETSQTTAQATTLGLKLDLGLGLGLDLGLNQGQTQAQLTSQMTQQVENTIPVDITPLILPSETIPTPPPVENIISTPIQFGYGRQERRPVRRVFPARGTGYMEKLHPLAFPKQVGESLFSAPQGTFKQPKVQIFKMPKMKIPKANLPKQNKMKRGLI